MSSPQAAGYLYLNPDTCLRNGVCTVDAAAAYIATLSPGAGIIDSLPSEEEGGLDYRVYLADSGRTADVSSLNALIMEQELREGLTPEQQEFNRAYVSNVLTGMARVPSSGPNAYLLDVFVGPNSLSVGDDVLIIVDDYDRVEATVTEVDYSAREVVIDRSIEGGERFRLVGVKVSDPLRIASVNLSRGVTGATQSDPDFNVGLYSLLYPDSRAMDPGAALEDYMGRAAVQDHRIGKEDDFLTNKEGFVWPYQDVRDLIVHDSAEFRGPVLFRGAVTFEREGPLEGEVQALRLEVERLRAEVEELRAAWAPPAA